MASFTQRTARAAALSGIDDESTDTLLKKADLTDRDKLHLWRVLLPTMLEMLSDDIAQTQMTEVATLESALDRESKVSELKQLEAAVLAAQVEIENELGEERVLVALDTYSEPRIGV